MCGRSGNQTPLILVRFFRTVRHSLRPNGARYGGTDGIEQAPLNVRTVSSQYNWRYPGFHRFLAVGSRARNPPRGPRLLTRCSTNKMHSHSAQEHGRNCICSGEHISPRKHKSCASGSRPLVCNPNRTSDDTRLDFFAANWRCGVGSMRFASIALSAKSLYRGKSRSAGYSVELHYKRIAQKERYDQSYSGRRYTEHHWNFLNIFSKCSWMKGKASSCVVQ